MKKSIYDLTLEGWEEFVTGAGHKKFRGLQIFEWLYAKQVTSLDEMRNVPKDLLEKIDETFELTTFNTIAHQVSQDGTNKFLFELHDGHKIETVLMRHKYGLSICVTTQVGCRIGCSFCASGLLGLTRNLEAGEIVAQIMHVARAVGERISHVVVMGIGEPFDNYDNVTSFLRIINHQKGLSIGARHITVSTSGIVPKIYDFANDHPQISLAISLHAPNDHLRSQIMKINKAYPLSDLMKAIHHYLRETNRRITFEYIMMKDINDLDEHAHQLAALTKGMNCYINLIPVNYVEELGIKRSQKEQIFRFRDILMKAGITVTIRREHGTDIDAACGQLRAKGEAVCDEA